jgi:hypothetical protein
VGFTEVSGAPATVRIDVVSSNGAVLATRTIAAEPNTMNLVTDIIEDRRLPPTSNFRVDFTATSPTGRVIPFATYVDDITGDGAFEEAARAVPSAEDIVISQTAHVTGMNNDFFKTDLHITNLDLQPVTITVSLLPLLVTGTPASPRVYTISPGQTLEKLDVLATEFGLADPSAGGLRIRPSGPARLAVSSRTYVEKFGGTFGYSVSGVPASRAIALGGSATAIQLDQTSAVNGYRSNFGFTEVGGAPATVRATVRRGSDGVILGTKLYAVGANASLQANVTDILGAGATASNIYIEFTVESGAGRVLPYAASIDNRSGDAIFIPAQ